MAVFSLNQRLREIQAQHLYRRRRTVERWVPGCEGTVAVSEGAERIVFCSNDYLGLAHHPKVTEAFQRAASAHGVGSGASHLVNGHSSEHHALEEALAVFTGRDRALLFSTGYMANLGVASALLARGDVVLEDRLNHASLLDAGLLSGARLVRYVHGDAAAADKQLSQLAAEDRSVLLMTDGVFSMDGDLAPLAELADTAKRHEAWLMVDDAHGLGILGKTGRGTTEALNVSAAQAPILMGTLGKALGTFGAFVAGSTDLIELLIQRARTYIFTTALPPAVAAATRCSLELIDAEPWRRSRLLAHVMRFQQAMVALGQPTSDSSTPIQPIVVGSAQRALEISEALWSRGLWITAIRPPTVPEGTARLRVTFSAAHTDAQVDRLIEVLSEVLPLAQQTS